MSEYTEQELEQNANDALLAELPKAEAMLKAGEDSETVLNHLQTVVWSQRKTNTKSKNTGHMVSEIGIAS